MNDTFGDFVRIHNNCILIFDKFVGIVLWIVQTKIDDARKSASLLIRSGIGTRHIGIHVSVSWLIFIMWRWRSGWRWWPCWWVFQHWQHSRRNPFCVRNRAASHFVNMDLISIRSDNWFAQIGRIAKANQIVLLQHYFAASVPLLVHIDTANTFLTLHKRPKRYWCDETCTNDEITNVNYLRRRTHCTIRNPQSNGNVFDCNISTE